MVERATNETDELKQIITKVNHIITWFRQSVITSDDLRKIQNEKRTISKKLKQYMVTR